MDQRPGQKRAVDYLYPPVEPFATQIIDVGDGHRVYVEEVGNPKGIPVLVLHGGPGGGSSPAMRRYFDPARFHVVLFDQRGCGRSRPHASVETNTTWHLVADIEVIRQRLGIDRFILFGGSWGATLALIYAISHPDRVAHLVLRGVFLSEDRELDWFYRGGAAAFWPDQWAKFLSPLPEEDRADPVAGYQKLLFSGDMATEMRAGQSWSAWENALASFDVVPWADGPSDYARAFARLENHYFTNRGFLDHDGWILANRTGIEGIGAVVVQGRYDMICPPAGSWRLVRGWDKARIEIVPAAGHALSEPGISAALVRAMDGLAGSRTGGN